MNLINFENYEIKIDPYLMLVRPFRKLLKEDRTKDKEHFMQQMSYLYFMVDPRSSYGYITDDNERAAIIEKQEGLPTNFKPSPLLLEAMEIYRKQTVNKSAELLQSTYKACDKVKEFLENINLEAEDDKGKPKYPINSITGAIDKVLSLIEKLQVLKKKVEQDTVETVRVRGNTDNKCYEDGFNFGK